MIHTLTIQLETKTIEALISYSGSQRRNHRVQAAMIIEDHLIQQGLLKPRFSTMQGSGEKKSVGEVVNE